MICKPTPARKQMNQAVNWYVGEHDVVVNKEMFARLKNHSFILGWVTEMLSRGASADEIATYIKKEIDG